MKIGKKILENGLEDYIIIANLPADYEDITSVSNWVKYGDYLFKDYKYIRSRLKEYEFASQLDSDKLIIAKYAATTEENRKVTLETEFDFWATDFDIKSIACRSQRFAAAKTLLIKYTDLMSRYMVIGFLNTTPLISNYVGQGIEGTQDNDPVDGLFDWVESTGSFVGAGMNELPLVMLNGVTKAELIVKIMDCLRNGNY